MALRKSVRRAVWAAGALVAVAAVAKAAAPRVAIWKAKQRAAESGVRLDVDSADVAWGRVDLYGVHAVPEWVDAEARLDHVRVAMDGLTVQGVELDGGRVEIRGPLKEAAKGRARGERTALSAHGIRVEWTDPCGAGTKASADVAEGDREHVVAKSVSVDCGWVRAVGSNADLRKEYLVAETLEVTVNPEDRKKDGAGSAAGSAAGAPPQASHFEARVGHLTVLGAGMEADADKFHASLDRGTEWRAQVDADYVSVRHPSIEGAVSASGLRADVKANPGLSADVSVRADSVEGRQKKVGEGQMTASSVRLDGTATAGLEQSFRGTAGLGKVELELELKRGPASWSASASMAPTECQAVVDSLPKEVVPALAGFKFSGTASVSVKMRNGPDGPDASMKMANGCKVTEAPPGMSASALRKKFMRTAVGADGSFVQVESGPGSKDWTPFSRVSPYMAAAVGTTEDGAFWQHKGFIVAAIEAALKEDIKAGRFVRGGSTVTMQLAKNLWLTRSKTLSRKVQEAFLTAYLEQVLTKREIMELYLNVVELGPGLYGVGPAAHHYFKSEPGTLTLGQALFLSSILPNPRQDWFDKDKRLQAGRMRYLHGLMKSMKDRGVISEGEYMDGLSEWVVFGRPDPDRNLPEDAMTGPLDTTGWE